MEVEVVHTLPAVPEPGSRISEEDVTALEEQVVHSVDLVPDISLAEEWRAQARAFEAYLRSKGLQRPMLGAQRLVEARIGEMLGEAEPGQRTDLTVTHAEQLERRADRSDFRLLARARAAGFWDRDGWRKSRRALVADMRKLLGEVPDTPPLPDGQFSCIVADPPWTLDTGPDVFGGTGESGHDDLAYEQMSLEDIAALLDPDAEDYIAPDDAHLYLWTTNRYLEASYGIARAWGFKPSVVLVWAKKPRGVGLGDTFRLTTEFVLFARRGSLPHKEIVPRTWFNWPRSTHSVKPEAFYEMVESVTPGPYVDLFARQQREGWTVWGHEV